VGEACKLLSTGFFARRAALGCAHPNRLRNGCSCTAADAGDTAADALALMKPLDDTALNAPAELLFTLVLLLLLVL